MDDEKLREFVDAVVSKRVFLSCYLGEDNSNITGSVFMPIAFGCFAEWSEEEMKQIGEIYEYMDKAGPRSIDGFPSFFSMQMIHVEDWNRAITAIEKEKARRKESEV